METFRLLVSQLCSEWSGGLFVRVLQDHDCQRIMGVIGMQKALGQTLLVASCQQDRSGNDTDADDADIRPIYDKEPMVEVYVGSLCHIMIIGITKLAGSNSRAKGLNPIKTTKLSDLRWKPMGCNFLSVVLGVPTGKLLTLAQAKVDSEPPHVQM
ncbi:hypothetical protein Tco_1105137 [Tanacetum coccineum]